MNWMDIELLEQSRLYIFAAIVIILAVAEVIMPIYKASNHKINRWFSNFGLSFLSTLILRFSFPILAVQLAAFTSDANIGLFNWIGFNGIIATIVGILLFDMLIYWQHVIAHHWPLLWRLHRVHHSDEELDVSSAIRFHPFEIIFSMLLKMAFILIIGPSALAILLFEIILSSGALFNHSNLRIPQSIDRYLQYIIVTPNMHRIHHSDLVLETNSNYGFSLSIWDRLFKSYTPNFDADRAINIGLKQTHNEPTFSFLWCLKYPFKK